jgi:hypothetical protein
MNMTVSRNRSEQNKVCWIIKPVVRPGKYVCQYSNQQLWRCSQRRLVDGDEINHDSCRDHVTCHMTDPTRQAQAVHDNNPSLEREKQKKKKKSHSDKHKFWNVESRLKCAPR